MTHRVLIAEDEPDVGRLIVFHLDAAGFATQLVQSGATAVMHAIAAPPAVVIVDLGLPDVDGIEVTRQLRAHASTRHVGIMVVTARGDAGDRIRAFEAGADDFLGKPFAVRELVLRLQRIARHAQPPIAPPDEPRVLRVGSVEVRLALREVQVDGNQVGLRPLEYRLLVYLMRHPARTFAREHLLHEVWGVARGNARMVDVVVSRLREALGSGAEVIETVPGFGYRSRPEP